MNGQNAFMNSSVGLTTSSAVASARSSAMVFGASSPRTMCSAVTIANAMATAMLWAVASAIAPGRNVQRRLDHRGQRRLADPAEADAGHRDAELGRGDVAVGIGDRAPHGARAAVPFGDQLIDARLADRDDREFRGDEKSVGEHERQHASEPPQRCPPSESSIGM